MKQKQRDNIRSTLKDYEHQLEYYLERMNDVTQKIDYYSYKIKHTKNKVKLLKLQLGDKYEW